MKMLILILLVCLLAAVLNPADAIAKTASTTPIANASIANANR